MTTEPPPALAASVAWESDGVVTCINVWDSPEAIAEFFVERVRPFVEAEGEPANKPQRLGQAVRAYIHPGGGQLHAEARPRKPDAVGGVTVA